MELTQEQKNIIDTVHDTAPIVKVNAYAGTGKTTTLVEVVKEIRRTYPDSRILYLVFNKMMAKEAQRKFEWLGVQCYTAHAFALRRIGLSGKAIEVLTGSQFSGEYLKLRQEEPRFKYVAYKNIKLLMDAFEANRLNMNEFLSVARKDGIVGTNFKPLDLEFFKVLYERLTSTNKYTHGMYLKEYALNYYDTIKNYDYVLLDEAQDLNPFMLDIIKRIERKKLYVVGDNYQQIYAWNNAINSMQEYEGELYPLSKSFRFNKEIRDIADSILRLQSSYRNSEVKITNVHNDTCYDKSKVTYLFRTNAAMLARALDVVMKNEDRIKVHFMDMINGGEANSFDEAFTEMLQFTKVLLDGCYGKKSSIYKEFTEKFPVKVTSTSIKNLSKISEKEGYESLFDYLLHNSYALSLEYSKYWAIFNTLRKGITRAFEKVKKAEFIRDFDKEYTFCTAHRSKGLEWEYVVIASDNWNIDNLDEINLLYVASTRAKRKLDSDEIKFLLEDIRNLVTMADKKEKLLNVSK